MNTDTALGILQEKGSLNMATERRPSPLRALLWKEWRQQRFQFLGLAFLPLVLLLIPGQGVLAWILPALAPVAWCALALVAGVTAFAGDAEDRTEEFLGAQPVRRTTIFLTKAVVPLGLIAVSFAIAAPLYPKLAREFPAQPYIAQGIVAWTAIICVLLVALAAIASVAARSAMACALVTVAAVVVAVAWLANVGLLMQAAKLFPAQLPPDSAPFRETFGAMPIVGAAFLLLIAGFIWARRPRATPGRRIIAASFGALIFLVGTAAPVVGRCAYFRFFITPQDYFRVKHTAEFVHSYVPPYVQPSPDGRHVAVFCGGYGPWNASRVAILDTDTGNMRWIDRDRPSMPAPRLQCWSPNGRRYLATVNDFPILLPPAGVLKEWAEKRLWNTYVSRTDEVTVRVSAGPANDHAGRIRYVRSMSLFVYDVDTGRLEKLGALFPEVPEGLFHVRFYGWVGDSTIAFATESAVTFINLDTTSVSRCVLPTGRPGLQLCLPQDWFTQRGSFAQMGDGNVLARFAPELKEAELIHLAPESKLLHVSPDGRWALAQRGYKELPGHLLVPDWSLISLVDGGETPLPSPLPSGTSHRPDETLNAIAMNLAAGGRFLVCSAYDERGYSFTTYFDLKTRRFVPWPIEGVQGAQMGELVFNPVDDAKALAAEWQPRTVWVVDLPAGKAERIWQGEMWAFPRWLGKDRVLIHARDGSLWMVNADGSGKRKLLPHGQ